MKKILLSILIASGYFFTANAETPPVVLPEQAAQAAIASTGSTGATKANPDMGITATPASPAKPASPAEPADKNDGGMVNGIGETSVPLE